MKKKTLRSRLILGFGAVIVPLIILLMYNNWYAMNVVRNQVAGSNQNFVKMYMEQIDQVLNETDKYLLRMALQDPDLKSLSSYPEDSMEAYFAKINTLNKLTKDITYYTDKDAFFAFGSKPKELLFAPRQQVGYDKKQRIKAKLEETMRDSGQSEVRKKEWTLIDINNEYFLLRLMATNYGSYIGACIDLNRLLMPLSFMEIDKYNQVLFASSSGHILTKTTGKLLTETISPSSLQKALVDNGEPLNTDNKKSGFMVVSRYSSVANIYLAVLLPVDTLLGKLPTFQRLVYATPVMASIALLLYLLFLQRSIAVPIHKLIQGMLQIRSGNLSARLETYGLSEFNAINETFNDMAEQVKYLKIDIYEEKLNTQKMEFKHLQAQIHPHFFMNCLNLIYNLAQMKNMGLVQKMAIHLVKHFRYTIRTNVTEVSLAEEMEHIRNYLSIQKVRFPEAFDFQMDIEPGVDSFPVPPLTVQPFVENALEHGFRYKVDQPFTVRVNAKQDSEAPDKYIIVSVEDNGKGFQSDILAKFQSGEYFRQDFGSHIGIWNVQHRCRLYYGSDAKIMFTNDPHGGAVVTLKLPIQDKTDQGRESNVPDIDR